MTFTKTQKTYLLRRLEKKMKKDFKTTSYRKVLSFSVSLIIPHSTLCGYPFRVNFRKNIFNFTNRYRDRGACLKSVGGGGREDSTELFHQAGWILSGNFLLSTEKVGGPGPLSPWPPVSWSLRYINNTLPTRKNLSKWGLLSLSTSDIPIDLSAPHLGRCFM